MQRIQEKWKGVSLNLRQYKSYIALAVLLGLLIWAITSCETEPVTTQVNTASVNLQDLPPPPLKEKPKPREKPVKLQTDEEQIYSALVNNTVGSFTLDDEASKQIKLLVSKQMIQIRNEWIHYYSTKKINLVTLDTMYHDTIPLVFFLEN